MTRLLEWWRRRRWWTRTNGDYLDLRPRVSYPRRWW